MKRILFFVLLLFLLPALAIAQPSKKAKKEFDEGVTHYLRKEYPEALHKAEKAVRIFPGYVEAWILKADVHREMEDTALAIDAYIESIRIEPDFFTGSYYSVAFLLFQSMEYEQSISYFEDYLGFEKIRPEQRKQAEFLLRKAEFAAEAVKDPVPFNPVLLPPGVNSQYDEYVNTISLDGRHLFFTRRYPSEVMTASGRFVQEDFFVTSMMQEGWSPAIRVPEPLNSDADEGNLNLSPDGTYAFFAANRPNGYGRYDIYASVRSGERWGAVFNLGSRVNSSAWDSQPCFSSDGRTLYFVSNRAGGQGSSDIWMTRLLEDGSWSFPENMGPTINTPYAEMTPVIHPDNQTLYFASEGHPGMGAMDMFVSRRQMDGSWGEPVNIGYPLNQVGDELNFVIHPNGEKAFFSRNVVDKGMEIFEIDLPPSVRPVTVTYVKGRIRDKENRTPLQSIFRLLDLESGDTLIQAVSDKANGDFMVTLPTNKSYALFAEKEGYYFNSLHFDIKGDHPHDNPFMIDIELEKIKTGTSIVLRNVFFDVDKYDLKPESFIELDKFVDLLTDNPNLKAEIGGHTDNTGSKEHNIILSENRAKAVYAYLLQKGIDARRLSYKGYGMSVPVASNDTPEGRQLNRRTEISFLEE